MVATPVCYETPKSRRWQQETATGKLTREWVALYTSDLTEVRDLLLANNPVSFLGLSRKSLAADPMGAPDVWSCLVEYGVSAVPDGLKPDELSFKITAGTAHITQSKETLYRLTEDDTTGSGTNLTVDALLNDWVEPDGYDVSINDIGKKLTIEGLGILWAAGEYTIIDVDIADNQWQLNGSPATVGTVGGKWVLDFADGFLGSAPDHQGAIGVSLDAVQGCDIYVPQMQWSLARQRAFVDFNYLRTVRSLVGKTNAATFFGFPAGSLLYLGCEPTSAVGTMDDGSRFLFWNLAHSFAQEDNRVALPVGPIIIPQKTGWNYVWAKYAPAASAGALVQRPTAVYVERVYDEGNYELLEIGS